MNIVLNGKATVIEAAQLTKALIELGYGEAKVATAINEEFVPATMRDGVELKEGDRLEVLAPMQGG